MANDCPVPDCSTPVGVSLLLCDKHWYQLPQSLRDAVWKTRKARLRLEPTPERIEAHRQACRDALAWAQSHARPAEVRHG